VTRDRLERLETFVQQSLGTPWVDESWDLTIGLDCWSYLWHCFNAMGVELPRNLWAAKNLFVAVAVPGAPGDVLYFESPGLSRPHLGLKLRGERLTDCNWGGSGVAIHNLTTPPWSTCLHAAWRYVGEAA
jgi:cell wall-associated NlpC family hydrolase